MEEKDLLQDKNKRQNVQGEGIHVAVLSDFFVNLPDDLFCTNNMYADFIECIQKSIDIYRPESHLIIDIYETAQSDENDRKSALKGFRKYVMALYQNQRRRFRAQLLSLSIFVFLGVLLEYFLYAIDPDLPTWIFNCLEIVSWVMIWQFAGYWAFEFYGQYKDMKRLRQISELEFQFHLWQ